MMVITAVVLSVFLCADGSSIENNKCANGAAPVMAELNLLTGEGKFTQLLEYRRDGKVIWSIPLDGPYAVEKQDLDAWLKSLITAYGDPQK